MENQNNLNTSEVALVVGAIASGIGAIVYSLKHVQKSSCCGGFFKCNQVVVDQPCPEPEPEPQPVPRIDLETNV